jgi:hypothetical protein
MREEKVNECHNECDAKPKNNNEEEHEKQLSDGKTATVLQVTNSVQRGQ